jgi:3D domain
MRLPPLHRARLGIAVMFATIAAAPASLAARTISSAPGATGGAGLTAPTGGLAPTGPAHSIQVSPPPAKLAHGRWLRNTTVTEYWPAPEAWFTGALVVAPGLSGLHRIDWLYSAQGISMQGEGIGLDGQLYHIDALGTGGWITMYGRATSPFDGWAGGAPYWRAGGFWRNRRGGVTYPLQTGSWSSGTGRKYVPLPGVSFALGASLPLTFLQSIAVDPKVIPLGSRVYIPAYRDDGHGGWFVAQDTGGAIRGHHIDVYRPPPVNPSAGGQTLTRQRIYVIKPATAK